MYRGLDTQTDIHQNPLTALPKVSHRLQELNDNPYHNYDTPPSRHVAAMYEAACAIAQAEDLSERDTEILLAAVIFHDIFQGPGHEEKSADFAREILQQSGLPDDEIKTVYSAVLSTKLLVDNKGKLYRDPQNIIAKILCDLDILANAYPTELFFEVNGKLREELGVEDEHKWWNDQIKFMEDHVWFTDFARQNWDPQKQANLEAVRGKLRELTQYATVS